MTKAGTSGRFRTPASGYAATRPGAGRHDPLRWGDDRNPLVAKILARPQWREMYLGFLRELTATPELSTPASARERILSWQEKIAPFVANDTGEDMKIEDRPAPWGNHGEYRLTTFGKDNFFQAKAESISLSF